MKESSKQAFKEPKTNKPDGSCTTPGKDNNGEAESHDQIEGDVDDSSSQSTASKKKKAPGDSNPQFSRQLKLDPSKISADIISAYLKNDFNAMTNDDYYIYMLFVFALSPSQPGYIQGKCYDNFSGELHRKVPARKKERTSTPPQEHQGMYFQFGKFAQDSVSEPSGGSLDDVSTEQSISSTSGTFSELGR